MRLDLTWLDLLLRRRLLVGYALGLALYVLVIVALYPEFEHSTSLNDLTTNSATVAALFGVSGQLTSPGGWMNGNVYANFFPLIILLLTIGYGASALAGQDEDGTLCLLAVLPVHRRTIVAQKTAAMAIQGMILAVVVAAVALTGRSFDVAVPPANTIAVALATLLMGVDFGLVAMAAGAATGSRGFALGVGTAVSAVAYLISSLAPVVHWIGPARYVSLFYWTVGANQIINGVSLVDYLVLAGVGIAAFLGTLAFFRRLDLH